MAKKNKRLYRVKDESMLVRAKVIKNRVEENLAGFMHYFPWVNAAYLAAWQDEINAAAKFSIDYTVKTGVKADVAEANKIMKTARPALRTLFRFARLVYPNDKKKQLIFGQQKMNIARNNRIKMLSLLTYAHSTASNSAYKNDLLARGYTQPEIDALKSIADSLREVDHIKGSSATRRPVNTQERISAHNLVFERLVILSKCARVVYVKNPALIKKFRIYPAY